MKRRVQLARQAVAEGHSATIAADAARVSRQSIYRRCNSVPRAARPRSVPPAPIASLDASTHTVEEAIDYFARTRVAYGYRMVWAKCRQAGYRVNRKKVARLLREWHYTRPRKAPHPKAQGRPFVITRPNELWQTDMTSIWCGEDGWAYFTAVIDTYCRSMIGWTFTRRCSARDVSPALEMAYATAFPHGTDAPDVVCRHDNGTQFTSWHYRDVAQVLGVKLSRTAYRHPDGNAFIERVFKTLKMEAVWCEDFENFEQALAKITWWINDYNNERPHQKLGYRTPREVRFDALGKMSPDPTQSAA